MDNKIFSRIAVWALVGLVLFTVFRQYEDAYAPPRDTISYTQFMEDAKAGKVRRVDIQGRTLIVTPQTGEEFKLTNPGDIWMWTSSGRATFRSTARPRRSRLF